MKMCRGDVVHSRQACLNALAVGVEAGAVEWLLARPSRVTLPPAIDRAQERQNVTDSHEHKESD